MRFIALGLGLVCASLAPRAALAQSSARPRASSAFWRLVRHPELRRVAMLQEQGRTLLRDAAVADLAQTRTAMLDEAIRSLRAAHRIAPRDASVAFDLAEALSLHEGGDEAARDAESLGLLAQVRLFDPTYETASVAFREGVVLTRRLRFADAVEAYERALRFALDDTSGLVTITESNLAETLMSLGRLDESVAHYERAIELSEGRNVLGLWGLAVAQDRAGRTRAALASAQRALTSDPRDPDRQMQALYDPGVFFVPEYDKLYYVALGFEARAEMADTDDARVRDLQRALASWRTYLSMGGSDGPWATAARTHLGALEARLGGGRR